MQKTSFTLIIILSTLCFFAAAQTHDIANGFRDPGKDARPYGLWNWLNGDITRAGITRDLEEAKNKGFGGLVIWDTGALRNPDGMIPAGPPFIGDESVELIHHAFSEAKRLDMNLGLVPSSGWNSGGSWVTPEMASKNLFYSSTVVSGPAQVTIELDFPEVPEDCPMGPDGMPLWYMDVAVLAWPDREDKRIADLSEVLNLTSNFRDGKLTWSPPPGNWQVARFVCSNNGQHLIAASPNSEGLLTRKLLVDRAFTEGVNHICPPIFAHSPVEDGFPGRSYHAGPDMNPQVVWWSKSRSFLITCLAVPTCYSKDCS